MSPAGSHICLPSSTYTTHTHLKTCSVIPHPSDAPHKKTKSDAWFHPRSPGIKPRLPRPSRAPPPLTHTLTVYDDDDDDDDDDDNDGDMISP